MWHIQVRLGKISGSWGLTCCAWMSFSSHIERNRRAWIQSQVALLQSQLVPYALWFFSSLFDACDILVYYGWKFVLKLSYLELMDDMQSKASSSTPFWLSDMLTSSSPPVQARVLLHCMMTAVLTALFLTGQKRCCLLPAAALLRLRTVHYCFGLDFSFSRPEFLCQHALYVLSHLCIWMVTWQHPRGLNRPREQPELYLPRVALGAWLSSASWSAALEMWRRATVLCTGIALFAMVVRGRMSQFKCLWWRWIVDWEVGCGKGIADEYVPHPAALPVLQVKQ